MLSSIKNMVYSLLANRKLLLILTIAFVFICIAVYVYIKHVKPMTDTIGIDNNVGLDKDEGESEMQFVTMYIFVVDWCPHSKKALPIWDEIKSEYENKVVNNKKIHFKKINGEEQSELADKYKVDGYPTIKLVKDNEVIEYDAKPNVEHLKQFIESSV
jgi:thiol-disulfide isomerase/thioredoxin